MTWKYSTDVMRNSYTINWSPSLYGTPYVNSIKQIDLDNISFQDVTFVYDVNKHSAYICAVIKDKQSSQTYDIPTFVVTGSFLYDMGLNCEDGTPKDDTFIKKLILILDKTGFWNSYSTKQHMKKKPTKIYNTKDLEYDPNLAYDYRNNSPSTVDMFKLKDEIKKKDALISELREQIQEMKEDIEMLKAVNQEC